MMQEIVSDELQSLIKLAIHKQLIPNKRFTEIEFNVLRNGQAVSIEHWSSAERRDIDHHIVEIPVDLQCLFIFKNTVIHL